MVGSPRPRIQFPASMSGVGQPTSCRRLVVAWALLLLGCASGPTVRLRPPGPVEAWGLATYPVVFRFPVSAYEAYDRGRKVAEQLSALTGRLVYGPGEFRLDDVDHDDLQRGTNLMGALKYSKVRRPEGLAAVRVVVERRVSSGEAQVWDATGTSRGRRRGEELIEVAVHAELLSMAAHGVVAELEGTAHVDPFSVEVDRDPYPDVTRLTGQLVQALVALAGLSRAERAPDPGLRTLDVPGPALSFALGREPPLRDALGALDALEQDVRMLDLIRLVDPDASRARIRLLRNAPHGLVVVEAKGPAAASGLVPDDLLLAADGESLTGRHVLDRHLQSGSCRLTVRRAGEEREVELAVPGP